LSQYRSATYSPEKGPPEDLS